MVLATSLQSTVGKTSTHDKINYNRLDFIVIGCERQLFVLLILAKMLTITV